MATSAFEVSYGKHGVSVYRVFATPLRDVVPIPESSFIGRDNNLLACEVDVEVFGEEFLPAYTHGDNTMLVATDSMKNFIIRESLAYPVRPWRASSIFWELDSRPPIHRCTRSR